MTEHQLQNSILGYLRMKGYYCFRMNSGKYAIGEGRQRRFIQGHSAGTPDVLAIKNGTAIFFEVKLPKKKPTPIQQAKMKELEEYGCACYVVHSLDELQIIVG